MNELLKRPLNLGWAITAYILGCLFYIIVAFVIFLLLITMGVDAENNKFIMLLICAAPNLSFIFLADEIKKAKKLYKNHVALRKERWVNRFATIPVVVLGPFTVFLVMAPLVQMLRMKPEKLEEASPQFIERKKILEN